MRHPALSFEALSLQSALALWPSALRGVCLAASMLLAAGGWAQTAVAPQANVQSANVQSAGVQSVAGQSAIDFALDHAPPGVTVEQFVLALCRQNPQAFIGSDCRRFHAVGLQMPTLGQAGSVAPEQARAQLLTLKQKAATVVAGAATSGAAVPQAPLATPLPSPPTSQTSTTGPDSSAAPDASASPSASSSAPDPGMAAAVSPQASEPVTGPSAASQVSGQPPALPIDPWVLIGGGAALLVLLLLLFKRPAETVQNTSVQTVMRSPPTQAASAAAAKLNAGGPAPAAKEGGAPARYRPALPPSMDTATTRAAATAAPVISAASVATASTLAPHSGAPALKDLAGLPSLDLGPGDTQAAPGPLDLSKLDFDLDLSATPQGQGPTPLPEHSPQHSSPLLSDATSPSTARAATAAGPLDLSRINLDLGGQSNDKS